jgi:hypothetical protein
MQVSEKDSMGLIFVDKPLSESLGNVLSKVANVGVQQYDATIQKVHYTVKALLIKERKLPKTSPDKPK